MVELDFLKNEYFFYKYLHNISSVKYLIWNCSFPPLQIYLEYLDTDKVKTSTADFSFSLVLLWILHFQPEASKKKSPPWYT